MGRIEQKIRYTQEGKNVYKYKWKRKILKFEYHKNRDKKG